MLLCVSLSYRAAAQAVVQTIRGTVVERSLQRPLVGATVVLARDSTHSTVTDASGAFVLPGIAVGRHELRISYIGYGPVVLGNLLLESGRELVLQVTMEDALTEGREVVVRGRPAKSRPLNEMAAVSARMFSVEETRRFAASLNDPSRMATAFAGVSSSGDGNGLVIRGNAPNGLMWRLEGVDIPNPNHFARVGTSGGAISILSANLLANSDFFTSAFPAEYGNALSGAFDIKLRPGNAAKSEHTFTASTIGFDAATEGYFKKGYAGSYLVNYRYSFLTLAQKMGLDVGDAPTMFTDLSFNIHLPTKRIGAITLFGFGGKSKQEDEASRDSLTWANQPDKRTGNLDEANTGATGITHSLNIGKKILIRTVLSLNGSQYRESDTRLNRYNGPLITTRNNRFEQVNAILSVAAIYKASPMHLFKAGLYTTGKSFDLQQKEQVGNVLRDRVLMAGDTRLTNLFAQWRWTPASRLSIMTGVHGQHFALNSSKVVEPRLGLKWNVAKAQQLSVGLGMHAQTQPLGNYFARIRIGNDTLTPNKSLGFSRATHYVLGYAWQFAPNWNLKAELYYQWLHDIPISALRKTSFSMINQEDDYAIEALANNGSGKNHGTELTLERFWNDQFYVLTTLSLYQSEYIASDGIWRNTRFNYNNASTILMGKEWTIRKKRTHIVGLDIKSVYTGGMRVTPIDLAKSIAAGTTVSDNTRMYEEKLPAYWRVDLQVEWKVQYRRITGSLIAGVQNLLDHDNAYRHYYDAASKSIKYGYLLGIIPVAGYRVDL